MVVGRVIVDSCVIVEMSNGEELFRKGQHRATKAVRDDLGGFE